MLPKITNGILGGMMGPMVEAAPTRAAEKTRGYPAFSMAGMRMLPVPTASATAAPDIPAMIMLVTTVTWPEPAADVSRPGTGRSERGGWSSRPCSSDCRPG